MSSMVCCTFATSPKVKPETFLELNKSAPKGGDYPSSFTNFFNPVRHDFIQILKPSKDAVDFVVDVFDQSLEELDKLNDGPLSKHEKAQGYYGTVAFAVLDERSAQDKTVIVCYSDETFDRETGDVTGEILRHWRVSFPDAHELVGLIENCEYPVIEGYVYDASQRFTNKDGVFEFTKGIKEMEGKTSA